MCELFDLFDELVEEYCWIDVYVDLCVGILFFGLVGDCCFCWVDIYCCGLGC